MIILLIAKIFSKKFSNSILILLCLFLTGCAATQPLKSPEVIKTGTGVKYENVETATLTYKENADGSIETTYDSKTPSLLTRIMEILTLGVLSK